MRVLVNRKERAHVDSLLFTVRLVGVGRDVWADSGSVPSWTPREEGEMVRVGVLVVVMVWRGEAVTTKIRFFKLDASRGNGSVLLSKSVSTRLECAALCAQLSGVGYNMELAAENPNTCTVLGTQTSILADGNSTLYCGTCKILGDACSATADCATMEPAAVCSAGVCVCPPGYSTSGMHCLVVPAAFGASCSADVQCQATTNHTVCTGSPKNCVCALNYKVNTSGNGCIFDYSGFGFTSYNGRLVYTALGISFGFTWDGAHAYCASISSQMFLPVNSADWDWMEQTTRDKFATYLAFPINDKASEGVVVWNNGTLVGNNPILKWPLININTFATNCVGMTPKVIVPLVLTIPEFISFGLCYFINPLSAVICEALP